MTIAAGSWKWCMKDSYDWIIVGGGFRSLIAAYAKAKQGHRVAVIERSKVTGGILMPIQVAGRMVDRGPQFFENFEAQDVDLMHEMLGPDLLESIGFQYRSFLNGIATDGFAIPDWRSLGSETALAAFQNLLAQAISNQSQQQPSSWDNASTLEELAKADGGEILADYMIDLCTKFTKYDPALLSPKTYLQVAIFGRKLLLDHNVSMDLKHSPMLDKLIAAAKPQVQKDRYNLYPKGKNIGVVREALEKAVLDVGAEIYFEHEITDCDAKSKTLTTNKRLLEYGKIFWGCQIAETETTLLGSQSIKKHTHALPEIFHFFEVPVDAVHPAHYAMNYDTKHLSTRTTNFCNYIDCIDDQGNGIICVEQPITKDSKQWEQPEIDQERIFEETQIFGNVTCEKPISSQSLKVPVTYQMPKLGFENSVNTTLEKLNELYGDDFIIPDPFTLTRKDALDDLRAMEMIA